MRILLLTQFLSSTKGGGEYLFNLMANAMAKKGHKVWIITHKVENEDYSQFHKNVKIEFVSSIKYEGGLPPTFKENIGFVLQAVVKGLWLIRKEKIELIHSNNFSPALSSSILSYLTRCPHITAVWDIFSLCGDNYWNKWAEQKGVSRLHAFLGPRFEKMILHIRHAAIHTISKASRDDLLKFGASKPIHIISPSIEETKNRNDIPNNLQFVYVGRLVFYKNLEIVIQAISIVKKSHKNVKLKIIGGGPHMESLMNIVKQLGLQENVEFCGYVSEDKKYEVIYSSIAMVFPSFCEGFGLVILESFSCNRPVIVSNVRPLSDIIEDKKDGFVVDAKDEKEWAHAMINLIENPSIALTMGKNGKKKLQEKYSLEEMTSKIESMYQDTISFHNNTNSL